MLIVMDAAKQMRKEVKQYIDTADEKVVKMIHAMLEVDAENDWWDEMPDNVKADVEAALAEAERGELIPHEEIKKRYSKWLAK
jgi:predicted transcriptional regulator